MIDLDKYTIPFQNKASCHWLSRTPMTWRKKCQHKKEQIC